MHRCLLAVVFTFLAPRSSPRETGQQRMSPQQDFYRVAGLRDLLDPVRTRGKPCWGATMASRGRPDSGLQWTEPHGPVRQADSRSLLSPHTRARGPQVPKPGAQGSSPGTEPGPHRVHRNASVTDAARPGRAKVVTGPGGSQRVNLGGLPGGGPQRCEPAGAAMWDPCVHCPFPPPGGRQGLGFQRGQPRDPGHPRTPGPLLPLSPRGVGKRSPRL